MPVQAQYSLGMTGQLGIPTADMQESGTFMAGGNYLPEEVTPAEYDYNTGNYFVNVTFLPFLELAYRCTFLRTYEEWSGEKQIQQDRSVSARLRLLQEGSWHPAFVVGTDDTLGTGFYASVYGVATRTFTLGGGHRLAVTGGWYFPLKTYNDVHDGPFAGVRYEPAFCRALSVMGEYDSQGVNLGASVRLWGRLSVYGFTREFSCLAGGVRYEYTLGH